MLYSSLHKQRQPIPTPACDQLLRAIKTRKLNNFSLSIPQANQIFRTLQHNMRNIYPFEMGIVGTHRLMSDEQEPYKQVIEHAPVPMKYHPIYERVAEHFDIKFLVYDKFNINIHDEELFNENLYSMEKIKKLKSIDYLANVELTKQYQKSGEDLLQFSSRFQSGNLSMVGLCDGIYHLLLHNDVNTSGYTSWFYFSVKAKIKGVYRFVILNYGKAGNMHNQGVKICVYEKKTGWRRGGENIACQPNKNLFTKDKFGKFNTLYFQFQFTQVNSEVYFSYNIPYTYNDLSCFLNRLQQKHSPILKRKLAGISLVGNKLQFLTITNFALLNQGANLPAIVLLARTHPGETVSSWIMHQFLSFITSEEPEARVLRDNFVFKIFPMVNPDGVIHGNYRCSLSGRDLNRRWKETSKQLFPQIYYIKNHIFDISRTRDIKMILDLHGHTHKKKVFIYGCNNRNEPHRCRLFPYIISKFTPYFQFKFCNFFLSKEKLGTARISLYNQLKNPYTYTIQTSQFGTLEGHWNMRVFNQIARSLAKSIIVLFKIKDASQLSSSIFEQYYKIENQLLTNSNLLKTGSDYDGGSDSEPSVDNIRYDRLTTLIKKSQSKKNCYKVVKSYERVPSQSNSVENIDRGKITQGVMRRPKTNYVRMKNGSCISVTGSDKKAEIESRLMSYRIRLGTKRMQKVERFSRTYSSRMAERTGFVQKKQKVETINYINLSLSIADEKQSVSSTVCRTPNFFRNTRGFSQDLFFKLNVGGSHKYSRFRRIN